MIPYGFKKKDGTINEQISAWPISANAASIIRNSKPILTHQELTKMSTNIEQFSYVSKRVALTQLYVELSLPLPAALRAAEADLRFGSYERSSVWIGFLLWSVFLCGVLAVFGTEYDLLPPTRDPSIIHGRPFFDYLYFEVITFTTVGYGDIIPTTVQGKFLAMCTALLGATHGVTFVAIILQALSHPSSGNDH